MQPDGPSPEAKRAEAAPSSPAEWRRLGWIDVIALALVAHLSLAITLPRIPSGICVADAGDLQLASKTLGVAHPPGYAAYVTLSHVFTRIPGIDPTVAVSILCVNLGVLALILTALIAIRLGVHPFVAAAASLALTAHPRIWMNLITPEVYVFSIAFCLAAVYALLRFLALGRARDLLISAFLIGVAIANRPPIILIAPFFLWAWWKSPWRPRGEAWRVIQTLSALTLAVSIPGVYSLVYIYVRDTPATGYNYLQHHNDESRELPEIHEGFAAKVRRVYWLASAEQFRSHVGNDWKRMRTKLRWLRYETLGRELSTVLGFGGLTAAGIWRLFRRNSLGGCVLISLGVQAFLYRLVYRDDGQAADMVPLLTCMAVLAAVGISMVIPNGKSRWENAAAAVVLILLIAFTLRDAPDRPNYARDVDATGYLGETNLAALPRDAVILSYWTHAPPLRYAQMSLDNRPDITVVTAQIVNWLELARHYAPRPVYVTVPSPAIPKEDLLAEGNLFRVLKPSNTESPP